MVHYIRFLSPPKILESSKMVLTVSAVVAVTTDLGDDFFAEDLNLVARIVDAHNADGVIQQKPLTWQGASRALKISLQCPESDLGLKLLPCVLDVWSTAFHLTDKQRAEPLVERRLALSNGSVLRIAEEMGDSIARHIWDASLGFLQYFDQALQSDGSEPISAFKDLVSRKGTRPLQVVELGAGCGIVGIAFAQIFKSNVLLTDLENASEILDKNVRLAKLAAESSLKARVLDWSEDVDDSISTKFDLVLVSDCIYNPDSSVHLVETLRRLSRQTPPPLILVGYKTRHMADKVFFDHMEQAQFPLLQSKSIQLRHQTTEHDKSPPTIKFYEYRRPT